MSIVPHACQECGKPMETPRKAKMFCSPVCRMSFNNRRMQRGAEAYDLIRAIRRERETAKAMGLWTELCRLELRWQQEDDSERPGRKSYAPPTEAIARLKDTGRLSHGEVIVQQRKRA